ncbi:MAG: ABC transporter permease, partial [Anaerolineae bacterium]|nr:ABC transporter permease [Anaerolineae bacterium]
LPLTLLILRYKNLAPLVLGVLGVLYTIPSIALVILLVPVFGLNATSIIVALVVYTQAILVRNFVTGFEGINPALLEAARGMGMSSFQIWWRVQLPLALPVMLAGIRIALVVSVAIAALGAKFGAGGLGKLLFEGVTQAGRYDKIWAGALSVSLLALVLNWGLIALEKVFSLETRIKRAEGNTQ